MRRGGGRQRKGHTKLLNAYSAARAEFKKKKRKNTRAAAVVEANLLPERTGGGRFTLKLTGDGSFPCLALPPPLLLPVARKTTKMKKEKKSFLQFNSAASRAALHCTRRQRHCRSTSHQGRMREKENGGGEGERGS